MMLSINIIETKREYLVNDVGYWLQGKNGEVREACQVESPIRPEQDNQLH